MPHSYVSHHIHCIFGTKRRKDIIGTDLKERLWAYMGGIARKNNMTALAIGGTANHVHLLLSLPTTMSVSHAMKLIKSISSKWIHETFPDYAGFSWQKGYSAFSISISRIKRTISYIDTQEEHHRRQTFEREYIRFLKKHSIPFDEHNLWQ